ncbi:hypothetical protein [Crossiella sp. NPDC003009]
MTAQPFPGRWLGGASLILGPLLLLAAVFTRHGTYFFFPAQLAGYAADPVRMTVSYSLFAVGMVLLLPAVLLLAARAGGMWAGLGASLVLLGLCARIFHAGVDYLAFRLVDGQGAEAAAAVVGAAYPVPHVFTFASFAVVLGWPVLAVGVYRAGVLGPVRAVALAAMTALPVGVLKGATISSMVAVVALSVALVPLGVSVLRTGPWPSRRQLLGFAGGAVAMVGLGLLSLHG